MFQVDVFHTENPVLNQMPCVRSNRIIMHFFVR